MLLHQTCLFLSQYICALRVNFKLNYECVCLDAFSFVGLMSSIYENNFNIHNNK